RCLMRVFPSSSTETVRGPLDTVATSTGIGDGRSAEMIATRTAAPITIGMSLRQAPERLRPFRARRDPVRAEADVFSEVGFINLWLSKPRADRGCAGAG